MKGLVRCLDKTKKQNVTTVNSIATHQRASSMVRMFSSSGWWSSTCRAMMRQRVSLGRMSPPCLALGLVVGASALYGTAAMWQGKVHQPAMTTKDNNQCSSSLTRTYASGCSSSQSSARKMKLKSGISMLPHPEKEHRGGEDAYFVHASEYCVGVADGVGGWAEVGVDPGLYSRELMGHAMSMLDSFQDIESSMHAGIPQLLLEEAHARTKARGSCTACIVCLHEGRAHAANLGDSGFMVVRNGVVEFISPQQQHDFNFPFQIGSPDSMSDSPTSAERHAVDVQPGDVLIVATDGLFDNVYPDEVAALVGLSKQKGESPQEAAELLAKFARARAADPKHLSPFAYGAQQLGYRYNGGKMDDITALVSWIDDDE